jgi:hypothetical protein
MISPGGFFPYAKIAFATDEWLGPSIRPRHIALRDVLAEQRKAAA